MIDSEKSEPQLERDGFAWGPHAVTRDDCESLLHSLAPVTGAGRRGLLRHPVVSRLAQSETILRLIRSNFDDEPFAVRAIYFDKSPEANWLVPWHQDLTIAVEQRIDVPSFGPWSQKDGVIHVQPPVEILQRMLTVRLHLDDADETNGALRVVPGSHLLGLLSGDEIAEVVGRSPQVLCSATVGSALLMRPLLLHASRRAVRPAHRRILHIEFASSPLPDGLRWGDCSAIENIGT